MEPLRWMPDHAPRDVLLGRVDPAPMCTACGSRGHAVHTDRTNRIRYPSPNQLGLGRYPCPCEASTTVRCTRHV